ncbi:unnamed protein product [Darwinula stevensoni]|uniref:Uncharacterized protein n=1 Tax=Darwinula stevensoni TaxID=69355 RepID=A0A7R9AGM9_9CRUS|nr:unnamed protein product [Darwinula stevensoni]CAG0903577.1 unnamed protein product [Darwinula stevensoni]
MSGLEKSAVMEGQKVVEDEAVMTDFVAIWTKEITITAILWLVHVSVLCRQERTARHLFNPYPTRGPPRRRAQEPLFETLRSPVWTGSRIKGHDFDESLQRLLPPASSHAEL